MSENKEEKIMHNGKEVKAVQFTRTGGAHFHWLTNEPTIRGPWTIFYKDGTKEVVEYPIAKELIESGVTQMPIVDERVHYKPKEEEKKAQILAWEKITDEMRFKKSMAVARRRELADLLSEITFLAEEVITEMRAPRMKFVRRLEIAAEALIQIGQVATLRNVYDRSVGALYNAITTFNRVAAMQPIRTQEIYEMNVDLALNLLPRLMLARELGIELPLPYTAYSGEIVNAMVNAKQWEKAEEMITFFRNVFGDSVDLQLSELEIALKSGSEWQPSFKTITKQEMPPQMMVFTAAVLIELVKSGLPKEDVLNWLLTNDLDQTIDDPVAEDNRLFVKNWFEENLPPAGNPDRIEKLGKLHTDGA